MILPQCARCKHLNGSAKGITCHAFSDDKVPTAILLNNHDHHKAYPGDHGIRFEPRQESSSQVSLLVSSSESAALKLLMTKLGVKPLP